MRSHGVSSFISPTSVHGKGKALRFTVVLPDNVGEAHAHELRRTKKKTFKAHFCTRTSHPVGETPINKGNHTPKCDVYHPPTNLNLSPFVLFYEMMKMSQRGDVPY